MPLKPLIRVVLHIPVHFHHWLQGVVYSRDWVAVWPTRKRSIPGTVSLVKQGPMLFFQWLPSRHAGCDSHQREGDDVADQACCSPATQGEIYVPDLLRSASTTLFSDLVRVG